MASALTSKESGLGNIVIKLEDSWSFLAMLVNLSNGRALEETWKPNLVSPFGIKCISLSEFLYIFDALLFHERIVLPLVKPMERYQDHADKLFESDVVRECRKKFILIPPEILDFQSYYRLRNKLVETALSDRRVYLIAKLGEYCASYRDYTKNIWKFKPKYQLRHTKTPWKIPSMLGKGGPLTYDAEACALSLLTYIPVFKTTSFLPTIRLLNDSIVYAWDYVKDRLESLRKEITRDLIKDRLVQNQEVFDIPFTLSLVLREIPDSSSPSQLFDAALRLRKDKSVSKFREWLTKFHGAQKEGNLGEIAKVRSEVMAVAESLRREFGLQNIEQKIRVGFSDVAKDVFDDTLNILTFKPPKNIVKRFLDSIEIWIKKRKIQHLFFMQQLGRTGINVHNIESELERCFGKSQDVVDLTNYIRNYSLGCDKTEEILNLKPRYLSKKGVQKFIKESNDFLKTKFGSTKAQGNPIACP